MTKILNKICTLWVQIRDLYFYFCRHAIIVNGYVDDHTWKGIRHRNWGDDLNYYFIRHITARPVVMYHNFKIAQYLRLTNYLCIGTLLDAVKYSNSQTVVWGTGVSGQERKFIVPKEIKSVRGIKTQDFLTNHHIECPMSFGDPASLLPLFYKPKQLEKRYHLGIIPHVIDQQYPLIRQMCANSDDILIIDLHHYTHWTDVIDQICSCDAIASSSLHGLIVSDAYAIPNCWIELSGKISGGYFKFYDYASSVARNLKEPYLMTSLEDLAQIKKICSNWQQPKIDVESIITSCPFKLKRKC